MTAREHLLKATDLIEMTGKALAETTAPDSESARYTAAVQTQAALEAIVSIASSLVSITDLLRTRTRK